MKESLKTVINHWLRKKVITLSLNFWAGGSYKRKCNDYPQIQRGFVENELWPENVNCGSIQK